MELIIKHLYKQYHQGLRAIDDVNLRIGPGMFGLLGPNGAGKSSLMRTIATLQDPDSGLLQLGDVDVLENPGYLRTHLGYLPQDFGVYPKVSARDLLDHIAWIKGIGGRKERSELVAHTLQLVNLGEHGSRLLGTFSGGMRQRFGIAQAIIGSPKLLIVDEPTAGLDPLERNRFYNILSELSSEIIVLLSTHIVEDVNTLCSRMAIMNQGRIVLEGRPSELIRTMEGQVWTIQTTKATLETDSLGLEILSKVFRGEEYLLRVRADHDHGGRLQPSEPNLEDLYFATIHRPAVVAK